MAFLFTAVGVGALGFQAWLLVHLRARQTRLRSRFNDLSARIWSTTATVTGNALETENQSRDAALNVLAGTFAPNFTLDRLGGGRVTLDSLFAPARPLMLVFTDPRCGPCYEILPDIGGWQRGYGDRLSMALVGVGDAKTNFAMTSEYGIHPVLLQLEREVAEAYELAQAPAAVLIAPDGRITVGPRYGANAIRQLVADTLVLAMPEAPRIALHALKGSFAPALTAD